MNAPSLVAAVLVLGLAADALAQDHAWRGPLAVRDQFPLELISLDFTPRDGAWLKRGEWGLEVGFVHANSFEISAGHDERVADFLVGDFDPSYSFVIDDEVTRAHVRIDFGVGSRVQLGLELPLLHHGGGFLDSIIDTSHDNLGLPGNDRDLRGSDLLEVDMLAGDERFFFDDSTTELGDVVLAVKVGLHEGSRHAVSLVAEAKAPTGDEGSLSGSGEWDFGLSLVGSAASASGRHVWHGGLGFFLLGEPEQLPIDFDDKLSGYFGYEYAPNGRWSVVAQAMFESAALPEKPGRPHGDPRAGLAVGFHHGGESWQISAGLLENLTTNDNTIDLGFFFLTSFRQ